MDVAVLGMGRMGRAVAGRLLDAGLGVRVWNRTPGRVPELVGRGANEADSPVEAAAGADGVLVSLADDEAVVAVVLGGGPGEGLAGALRPGQVLVDMSTVAPATTARLAEAVDGFVASPILGAPQAVASGAATYLVAGPEASVGRLTACYEALGGTCRRLGTEPPLATTVKVMANSLLLAGLGVLAEVVATGQAAGLDDDTLRRLLADSPLVAPALRNRLDDVVAGDHRAWFTTALGAKDARLMAELADGLGVDAALVRAVRARYDAAAAAGYADADIAAVVELARPRG